MSANTSNTCCVDCEVNLLWKSEGVYARVWLPKEGQRDLRIPLPVYKWRCVMCFWQRRHGMSTPADMLRNTPRPHKWKISGSREHPINWAQFDNKLAPPQFHQDMDGITRTISYQGWKTFQNDDG